MVGFPSGSSKDMSQWGHVGSSLQQDPLEKEIATQIFIWGNPTDRKLVLLQSMGSPRVRHAWAHTHVRWW